MSLFNFDEAEILTFFAVLVRYSVLISVLPFFGDKVIPMPVKVLLSLALSICLFPALVARGRINPADALVWGATPAGIASTIVVEALLALALGFVAKIAFDAVNFGGNMVGTFMGFAMANTYDHRQESQTQVVAEIQMALAMMLFLALDGHHFMLAAGIQSYNIVGLGGFGADGQSVLSAAGSTSFAAQKIIALTSQIFRFGIQIAAPVAVVMFGINVAFGVLAKALPQLNVLVLSAAVSGLVGLAVMFLSLPEFQGAVSNVLAGIPESMNGLLQAIARGR